MKTDVINILNSFLEPGMETDALQLSTGHINKTYKILVDGTPAYILQQINHKVFSDIDGLMQNTRLVLSTLAAYVAQKPGQLQVQDLIQTLDGKWVHRDNEGGYWRMFSYINGAKTIESVRRYSHAYEGGKAYGMFLEGVSGLTPDQLTTVIPDFHSLELRYKAFEHALELNPVNRKPEAAAEIAFARGKIDSMMLIPEMILSGELPLRIVHNDTKFNNLIFSSDGRAIAVTDLDTVMPGTSLFDFGDAIRTAANKSREDEPDVRKILFDISVFESFAAGYIESAGELLTGKEIELFPVAAQYMTYIMGIRFLTDFLHGDEYYHTRYPGHNLTRCRAQFALLGRMDEQIKVMDKAISRVTARLNAVKS